jgi:hypothetical protein
MAIKVSDQYRKNELSLSPGGSEVKAVHSNGKTIVYDKIKNVNAYCVKLKKDSDIVQIIVDETIYWTR